jgi:hypothetical protein
MDNIKSYRAKHLLNSSLWLDVVQGNAEVHALYHLNSPTLSSFYSKSEIPCNHIPLLHFHLMPGATFTVNSYYSF